LQIKLKLGKEETVEAPKETESTPATAPPEQKKPDDPPQPEQKQNVDALRTVIKVNQKNPSVEEAKTPEPKKEQKPPAPETKETAPTTLPTIPKVPQAAATQAPSAGSREDLEQRRNILQSIKDFDFQIKKNQEDIGKITEKIDGLTKDLDDLVSLYEIVSEQMNPFVGLSKVTKKRLDALENFTKEIEILNTRLGDIESVLEKNKMVLTGGTSQIMKTPIPVKPTNQPPQSEIAKTASQTGEIDKNKPLNQITQPEITKTVNIPPSNIQNMWGNFTDEDLDRILLESLSNIAVDQNIDTLITDYLLNLK
jgi:hypothetical protein